MDQFIWDGGIRGHADPRNRQVGLIIGYVGICSDDMVKQVNSVVRNCVRWLASHKRDGVLFKRPHVHATVCPVSKQ